MSRHGSNDNVQENLQHHRQRYPRRQSSTMRYCNNRTNSWNFTNVDAFVVLVLTLAMVSSTIAVHAFTTMPSMLPPSSSTTRTMSSSSSSLSMSSSAAASSSSILPEGLVKQITQPSPPSSSVPNLGDIITVKYTCYAVEDGSNDKDTTMTKTTTKPFAKSTKQKMVVGDGSMVSGWDLAVRSMKVGERAIVRVVDTDKLGYGTAGVPPLIQPNQQLEFDITLLDCQSPTLNIDFDSIATLDNTPRTASEIAAAYEQRQAIKAAADAATPNKEGLEAIIDKVKGFYFFGFFEGETGQQAPWILRPSITFPIAFAIVGAAFYVSVLSGAISERGAESVDELDEIILSSANAAAAAGLSASDAVHTLVDSASHVLASL